MNEAKLISKQTRDMEKELTNQIAALKWPQGYLQKVRQVRLRKMLIYAKKKINLVS